MSNDTIRSSAKSATTSLLDTVSITARTVSGTVGSAGRMIDALYAKSDAYATEIEAKARAQKAVAVSRAEANFIIEHAEFLTATIERKAKVDQDAYAEARKVWESIQ